MGREVRKSFDGREHICQLLMKNAIVCMLACSLLSIVSRTLSRIDGKVKPPAKRNRNERQAEVARSLKSTCSPPQNPPLFASRPIGQLEQKKEMVSRRRKTRNETKPESPKPKKIKEKNQNLRRRKNRNREAEVVGPGRAASIHSALPSYLRSAPPHRS